MTFDEAVSRLYRFIDYERIHKDKYSDAEFNLDGFRAFVKQFGDPQEHFRSIHVTGTDGKGSVCRMMASMLQQTGANIGLYTSPHLECITERIQVNGRPIPGDDFTRLLERLLPVAEGQGVSGVAARSGGYATVFEILTALAWIYFQEQNVDWAVNEVGLGGRLDATNILNPELCFILPIDLEHTSRLGHTLESIAREKLGIVKPGVPVVAGRQVPELRPVFETEVSRKDSHLVWADRSYNVSNISMSPEGMAFTIKTSEGDWELPIWMNARGRHQIDNALTAITGLRILSQGKEWEKDLSDIITRGLAKADFPGRCEVFKSIEPGHASPTVILDGAHTPQALRALRNTLDELWPDASRTFVLGALRDKNPATFRENLLRSEDTVLVTRAADNPRAMNAEDLAGRLGFSCEIVPEPESALESALTRSEKGALVIATGSIYLIGGLRSRMKNLGYQVESGAASS